MGAADVRHIQRKKQTSSCSHQRSRNTTNLEEMEMGPSRGAQVPTSTSREVQSKRSSLWKAALGWVQAPGLQEGQGQGCLGRCCKQGPPPVLCWRVPLAELCCIRLCWSPSGWPSNFKSNVLTSEEAKA